MRNILIAGATLAAIAAPASAVVVETVTIGLNDVNVVDFAPGSLDVDFVINSVDEANAGAVLVSEPGDEAGVSFSSVVESALTTSTGQLLRSISFTLTDGATWTSLGTFADSFTDATQVLSHDGSRLTFLFADGEPLGISLGDVGFGGDDYVFNANGAERYALLINAAAVPEPAAWALMIVGFGLVGGALRRRVATAAVAA